jgi:hypothetical protein
MSCAHHNYVVHILQAAQRYIKIAAGSALPLLKRRKQETKSIAFVILNLYRAGLITMGLSSFMENACNFNHY